MHHLTASTLSNSSRKDKAKLGGTWPRSAWEPANNQEQHQSFW